MADWEEFGDDVDISIFEQILEMDEDESDREFSQSIVFGFFEQAETTFRDMRDKLADKDLPSLSSLGHFLKGSSATLGYTKIKDECEKIQHYGNMMNEAGDVPIGDREECLRLIKKSLSKAENDYEVVKVLMEKFYSA